MCHTSCWGDGERPKGKLHESFFFFFFSYCCVVNHVQLNAAMSCGLLNIKDDDELFFMSGFSGNLIIFIIAGL